MYRDPGRKMSLEAPSSSWIVQQMVPFWTLEAFPNMPFTCRSLGVRGPTKSPRWGEIEKEQQLSTLTGMESESKGTRGSRLSNEDRQITGKAMVHCVLS